MSFDLGALRQAVDRYGSVSRVVVAETRGSVPREVGAAMLVWSDGASGTIGGGALEWEASQRARNGETGLARLALGPGLGQCCGGAVTLMTQRWDARSLAALVPAAGMVAVGSGPRPPSVDRAMAQGGATARLVDGWLVEPLAVPRKALWIWGAGHVGRALIDVLGPLPSVQITWLDTAEERFPAAMPDGVTRVVVPEPPIAAAAAPATSEHLILTYSHRIDLALCDALLRRRVAGIGLIGSATKLARFRSRLSALGHAEAAIGRIRCPIGDPALGKHPQAIAIGVAAALLCPGMESRERRTG